MSAPAVAFLVKTYPKLSETFILGEILGLEARGLPLTVFALQRPTDALQQDANRRVRAQVHYLGDAADGVIAALREHAAQLLRSPLRYLRVLGSRVRQHPRTALRDVALAGRLARHMRTLGLRHVHAHFASHPGMVASLAAALTGGTYSISAHAKDIYLADPAELRGRMAGAAFTVTCTCHNQQHLRGIAAPGTPVHLMYHGIDFRRFAPEPRPENPAVPLVLAVGRLRDKKGFAALVEACARLRDQGLVFRCEIVGYGEEQARLEALIRRHCIEDRVRLAGVMTHAELAKRYQAAAVFAAPCRIADDGDRDGIPNVLLEAMAMELPVVSTPVSGIPEVVHDRETGMLVPPDDPKALAATLSLLLSDPALRRHLGAAARRWVQRHFDNDRNLDTVHGLLATATGAGATETDEENVYA